jgi:hypothetical protein
MKTYLLKLILSISISILIQNIAFPQFLQRGHSTDDLYFSAQPSFEYVALFRCTENGSTIQIMDSVNVWDTVPDLTYLFRVIPDPDEGFVYCMDRYDTSPLIQVSADFGSNWTESLNSPLGCYEMAAGSIPGEVYISCIEGLMRSSDYAQTFQHVNDAELYFIETGTQPGELWSFSCSSSSCFLLHSINGGVSFDTIPAPLPFWDNGVLFVSLSRGAQDGELFVVTRKDAGIDTDSVFIYRSLDYSQTFNLIHSELIDNLLSYNFSASRSSCSLYILRYNIPYPFLPPFTYWIDYSSDCGSSWTSFEHIITGMHESGSAVQERLMFQPNPAKDMAMLLYSVPVQGRVIIRCFDLFGRMRSEWVNETFSTGEFRKDVNIEDLSAGIYIARMSINGTQAGVSRVVIK